jgi:hypothetical protein
MDSPERVLKIFPLRPILRGADGVVSCNCPDGPNRKAIGKHPFVRWRRGDYHGNEKGPGGGFGIPTGAANGILVIAGDIKPGKRPDGEPDGTVVNGVENLRAMGPLPETHTVRSPSGSVHFYFQLELRARLHPPTVTDGGRGRQPATPAPVVEDDDEVRARVARGERERFDMRGPVPADPGVAQLRAQVESWRLGLEPDDDGAARRCS